MFLTYAKYKLQLVNSMCFCITLEVLFHTIYLKQLSTSKLGNTIHISFFAL